MSKQNKTPSRKELKSGERHIRSTLDRVGKWHKWRYGQVLPYITNKDTVLDLGCGVGYGSFILSENAKQVVGVDDSQETINYANVHWLKKNIEYICRDVFEVKRQYNVVAAFEIIEHIKDTERFFEKLAEITKDVLVLSVPHSSIRVKNKFHWRHFTKEEITKYITNIGFKVERIETLKFGNGLAVFCVARRKRSE